MEFLIAHFWYFLAGFLGFFVWRRRRKKKAPQPVGVLVIGHRGAAGHALENSLSSFKKALSFEVDFVEADVRRSKDGVFVLSHNDNPKGKQNKNFRISELSFSFLRKLSLPKRNRLVSAEDFLKIISSSQKILFDLKVTGFEFEFLSFLRKNNLVDRVMVSSHFAQSLRLLKVLEPNLIVGISFPRDRLSTIGKIFLSPIWFTVVLILKHTYPFYVGLLCSWAKADFVAVYFRFLTARLVKAAHKRRLSVYPFVVNRQKNIKRMLRFGVDGIISDYPDRVRTIIKNSELRIQN